jgi:hypothetical protein
MMGVIFSIILLAVEHTMPYHWAVATGRERALIGLKAQNDAETAVVENVIKDFGGLQEGFSRPIIKAYAIIDAQQAKHG